MATYLLGVQRENSSLRIAWKKGVTAIPEESLKAWLKEHIPPNTLVQAVLTVAESHIILKELELPNLKASELTEAVHWELFDKSGVGEQSASTWQIVEKQGDLLRVAAMIMKKSEVAEAIAFFADAGVELIAIEPSSVSAGRILTIPDKTSVLLSFDNAEVSAVFIRGRVPVFSTSFTIPLTDAAIRAKHFSREAASSLVSQLKRVISYWNAKERPVTRIIVTSEAARYSGLKRDVARGLGVPFEVGDADAAVRGASRRVGDEVVNFLPKEHRISLEKKARNVYLRMRLWQFVKVNVIVLLLLGVLSAFLWISQLTYTKNITQTQRFIDNHPAQKFISHITTVNALAKEISTLMANQQDSGERLRYLSSVTPPSLHYTSLKMVGGAHEEWAITGIGDRTGTLAFYYKLKADGQARDVTMPYSNFNRETDSPFTVIIVW